MAPHLVVLARRHRLILIPAVALLVLAVLYLHDPALPGNYPPCPFHWLTGGGYCPGCGSLRCIHALLHGQLHQAWAYNPLTVVTLPGLALWFAGEVCREKLDRRLFSRLPRWFILGYAAVVILFWILRNLDCLPFRLLAPHRIGL
jgi:hypothetical protein